MAAPRRATTRFNLAVRSDSDTDALFRVGGPPRLGLRAEVAFAEGRDAPAAVVRVDPEEEPIPTVRFRRAKGPRPCPAARAAAATAGREPTAQPGAPAGPGGAADAAMRRKGGSDCGGGAVRAWAVGAAGVGCGLGRLVRRAVGGAVARVLSARPSSRRGRA